MKILHLLSSDRYSGAENVVCTICNFFKDEFDMVYCSPKGQISQVLKEKGIKNIMLNKLSYSELKKVIDEYKPNVIHAHDYKASCIASLFYKKCTIISHIHGNNKLMTKLNIKSLLYKICSKRFHKIIWVSDSAYKDYYFSKQVVKKSQVLYNVINADDIKRKIDEYKSNNFYDVVYVGRLAYPKNPKRLIEVMNLARNMDNSIKMAIVGTGSDEDSVKELVEEYNLNENVHLLGYRSNPFPIMNNSKLLLMTSIYEGTPMVALEALALGLPIVSTPVDGLLDLVKNDYNGFLSDDNNELAEYIVKIKQDKDKKYILSCNSKEVFNRFNDVDKYKDVLRNLYKRKE